jgi:hypothetical protein
MVNWEEAARRFDRRDDLAVDRWVSDGGLIPVALHA